MRFDIISLFPQMFTSPFGQSIIARAVERGLVEIHCHDLRDYASGKHRITDDAPFGGGGGMIMKIEPIASALEAILGDDTGAEAILLSPQGELFTQNVATRLAGRERVIFICGRYDGVDERVSEHLGVRELSLGDFILTGGELAAMVVVDAVTRLLPGVLGNSLSCERDSFAKSILGPPQYTRPAEYRGWKVPDVLLSGHREKIAAWRESKALERTRARRPGLLAEVSSTKQR